MATLHQPSRAGQYALDVSMENLPAGVMLLAHTPTPRAAYRTAAALINFYLVKVLVTTNYLRARMDSACPDLAARRRRSPTKRSALKEPRSSCSMASRSASLNASFTCAAHAGAITHHQRRARGHHSRGLHSVHALATLLSVHSSH